jgi:signal transduction histidine kinase
METASPSSRKLVVSGSVVAVGLAAITLAIFPSAVRGIFSSSFLPHSYCYLFDKQLIALNVGTDTIIFLSYLAISCTLVYLVWRTRREVPFSWMFLAFGLFIVACGFTHLMEVVVLWKPLYWLAGDVKLITALASVVTAIALPAVVPQVHDMVTAAHLSEDRRLQLERANADLQHLSARVMSTQDEERRRIARELHDGIGQYLVAIRMSSGIALERSADPDCTAALKDSLELLDRCTSEVRIMSHLLHPPLLEEIGLAAAIPWYLDGFTKRSGIQVDVEMPSITDRLPQDVEVALFRVLQETLTNIHRHSGSTVAKVRLQIRSGSVLLAVGDNGKGFGSANGQPAREGVGLASMRERVRELGGTLRIISSATGTTIEASVPLVKSA